MPPRIHEPLNQEKTTCIISRTWKNIYNSGKNDNPKHVSQMLKLANTDAAALYASDTSELEARGTCIAPRTTEMLPKTHRYEPMNRPKYEVYWVVVSRYDHSRRNSLL